MLTHHSQDPPNWKHETPWTLQRCLHHHNATKEHGFDPPSWMFHDLLPIKVNKISWCISSSSTNPKIVYLGWLWSANLMKKSDPAHRASFWPVNVILLVEYPWEQIPRAASVLCRAANGGPKAVYTHHGKHQSRPWYYQIRHLQMHTCIETMILSSTNLNEIEAKRTPQECFDGNKNEITSWAWTMYIITHVLFWSCIAPWIGHLSSWIGYLWNRAWSLQSWQHTSSTLTSLLTSFWIPWLGFVDAGIWGSTLAASAHICRIINQFWRFQFEK